MSLAGRGEEMAASRAMPVKGAAVEADSPSMEGKPGSMGRGPDSPL